MGMAPGEQAGRRGRDGQSAPFFLCPPELGQTLSDPDLRINGKDNIFHEGYFLPSRQTEYKGHMEAQKMVMGGHSSH